MTTARAVRAARRFGPDLHAGRDRDRAGADRDADHRGRDQRRGDVAAARCEATESVGIGF